MRILLAIAVLVFSACSDQGAKAQPPTRIAPAMTTNWTVDKSQSSLAFTAIQGGESFSGTFTNFDVQINFNPDNLEDAKVVVMIDMASAEAGDKDRNAALVGKEWFFVKKFPTAKFVSTDFTHLGGDKYQAKADLSLRGITKELVLPFTLKIEDGYANMDATLTLNRRDYNVGTGAWQSEEWAKHNVDISIIIKAKSAP